MVWQPWADRRIAAMKTRRGAIYRPENIKRRRRRRTAQRPKIQVLDGDRPTQERRPASPAAQPAPARQARHPDCHLPSPQPTSRKAAPALNPALVKNATVAASTTLPNMRS